MISKTNANPAATVRRFIGTSLWGTTSALLQKEQPSCQVDAALLSWRNKIGGAAGARCFAKTAKRRTEPSNRCDSLFEISRDNGINDNAAAVLTGVDQVEAGNHIRNFAPWPGSDSMSSWPPCRCVKA